MNCYTIVQAGIVEPGIEVNDGCIDIGTRPVDGAPLRIPTDPRSFVEGGRLMQAPGRGALIVIRDHAGKFGSWHLRAEQPPERYDAMLASEALPNALDRILACERVRARWPHHPPVGWYEFTPCLSGSDPCESRLREASPVPD